MTRLIIVILIIVILVAFFPRQMQTAWDIIKTIWSKISDVVLYFWNLFITYIWQPLLNNLNQIKSTS